MCVYIPVYIPYFFFVWTTALLSLCEYGQNGILALSHHLIRMEIVKASAREEARSPRTRAADRRSMARTKTQSTIRSKTTKEQRLQELFGASFRALLVWWLSLL